MIRLDLSYGQQIHEILARSRATSATSELPNWTLPQVSSELESTLAYGHLEDGKLIAFVFFREVSAKTTDCNTAPIYEISFLATDPMQRKRGVMRHLMKTVLPGFLSSDHPKVEIWLEVHERNQAARALYEQLGFKVVGERRRYYGDGGAAKLYSLIVSSPLI